MQLHVCAESVCVPRALRRLFAVFAFSCVSCVSKCALQVAHVSSKSSLACPPWPTSRQVPARTMRKLAFFGKVLPGVREKLGRAR